MTKKNKVKCESQIKSCWKIMGLRAQRIKETTIGTLLEAIPLFFVSGLNIH